MLYYILIPLFFITDQLTKLATVTFLDKYESVKIIGDFLKFTHVHNTGGPWSILDGVPYVFIIMTIVIFALGFWYFRKNQPQNLLGKISLCMIAGGALGNFADRILRGYVVDMIDINLFDYPVFNVADCFIVIGAILMCVYILFFTKEN